MASYGGFHVSLGEDNGTFSLVDCPMTEGTTIGSQNPCIYIYIHIYIYIYVHTEYYMYTYATPPSYLPVSSPETQF